MPPLRNIYGAFEARHQMQIPELDFFIHNDCNKLVINDI